MSESGDSFEEIGSMQSGLSGSASISDQKSSNLNNDNQHPSSESPANTVTNSTNSTKSNSTMASSTNPEKSSQLNELEFELELNIRDEVIENLSEYTMLLSGLVIKTDYREMLQQVSGELILTLLNLRVKADGRSRSSESSDYSPNDRSNQVLFELDSDVRCRIVDTLMTNCNVAELEADSFSSEFKSKLIIRNNELICELLNLKPRTVSKGDHRIDQASKASGSQTISRSVATNETKNDGELNSSERPDRNQDAALQQQKLVEHPVTGQAASSPTVEEVAILKEELQKLKIMAANEFGDLGENVRDLKQKLTESKRLDICRNEITFATTFKSIYCWYYNKSINELKSEAFHFRGIPWHLRIGTWKEDEEDEKYMSVHLETNGIIDKDWSTVMRYEFQLLASDRTLDCNDLIRSGEDRNFEKPDSFAGSHKFGWNKFATVSQLARFTNCKDIKIRVHLSTESLQTVQD